MKKMRRRAANRIARTSIAFVEGHGWQAHYADAVRGTSVKETKCWWANDIALVPTKLGLMGISREPGVCALLGVEGHGWQFHCADVVGRCICCNHDGILQVLTKPGLTDSVSELGVFFLDGRGKARMAGSLRRRCEGVRA